ncbi:MAG: hypothetical protein DRQ54_08865 [Gammaproteobacteria bacterium]|nr:MAG: hypothetical protein DRQ54_08865 [Gammaproteobacteria bacterium]
MSEQPDFLTPGVTPNSTITPQLSWQPLGYYNFFRLVVSAVFCALANSGVLLKPLGAQNPQLFTITSNLYLVVGVFAFLLLWLRRPTFLTQAVTLLFIDVIAIIMIMHSSGGTGSGVGILLVIIIAASGLLLPRQLTLLVTAFATLGLLAEQVRWWFLGDIQPEDFTRAGVLGFALFATATISFEFARRARASANLAATRGTELRNLARLNEEIIQRMQTGVIVTTEAGIIEQANRAARRLTGSELEAGQSLELTAPRVAEKHSGWQRTRNQPAPIQGEKTRTVLGPLATPVNDGQPTPQTSSTLIFIDDATAMAQQAQLMKMASLGALTASIAHEIRNPLAAIATAGELIKENAQGDAETTELTEIISRHATRVNRIIDDILQMGRLKTHRPQPIEITHWLKQFIDDYLLTHGLTRGAIKIDSDSDLTVEFDPDQLHQVLCNLCDNAIQHSITDVPKPWVVVKASYDPAQNQTLLTVSDNGPGVPADSVTELFTPFFTTRNAGTGLGLYIAQELCASNQATLAYTDQGGFGATFQILFNDPQQTLIS